MPLHPWRRESFRSLFRWSEGVERREEEGEEMQERAQSRKGPQALTLPCACGGAH